MDLIMRLRSRFSIILLISFLLTVVLFWGSKLVTQQAAMVYLAGWTVILVLLTASALVYILVSRGNQRIRVLIGTAEKLQANRVVSEDLRQLDIIASRRDDIGRLARVLRDMALVITEREQYLSDEIAHLQAQVQAGSQQATGLEMAYYKALRKKSIWLRQQLLEQ